MNPLMQAFAVIWTSGRAALLRGLGLTCLVLAMGAALLGVSGWFITAAGAAVWPGWELPLTCSGQARPSGFWRSGARRPAMASACSAMTPRCARWRRCGWMCCAVTSPCPLRPRADCALLRC